MENTKIPIPEDDEFVKGAVRCYPTWVPAPLRETNWERNLTLTGLHYRSLSNGSIFQFRVCGVPNICSDIKHKDGLLVTSSYLDTFYFVPREPIGPKTSFNQWYRSNKRDGHTWGWQKKLENLVRHMEDAKIEPDYDKIYHYLERRRLWTLHKHPIYM